MTRGKTVGNAITAGGFFSGIAAIELAFQRAGVTCLWGVEKDEKCRQVLAVHFPHTKLYNDINEELDLEKVDIVCGGWPCQDLSVAGKREGLAGKRSGLFFRMVEYIQKLKPRWIILENVPGLFSANKGQDWAVALKALTECGYCVAWRVLDAQWFGVAQRRRRVFIVGSLGNTGSVKVLFEPEGGKWDSPPSREAGSELAKDIRACIRGGSRKGRFPIDFEAGLVANALTSHHGRNDPTEETLITTALTNKTGGPDDNIPMVFQSKASASQSMNPSTVCPTIDVGKASGLVAWHENKQGDISIDGNGIAKALRSGASHSYQGVGVRRLTPTECERLMGLPDGYTDVNGMSDSARYRMIGNAVAVPVVEWIARRIVDIEKSENEDRS